MSALASVRARLAGRLRALSLRQRLVALLLALVTLVWVGAGFGIWVNAREEVAEVMDSELLHMAALLLSLIERQDASADTRPRVLDFPLRRLAGVAAKSAEYRLVFAIYDARNRLLVRSTGSALSLRPGRHAAFSEQQLDGETWRMVSYRAALGTVLVGMPKEPRDEMVEYILIHSLWPMLVSLLVILLLVWWGIGRGLSPLARVTRALSLRDADDLGSLDLGTVPVEIRPLVDALNRLLARLAATLENERRFTADAAHELRTPLAAIKIQAEVAQREASEPQRGFALQQVVNGIDRASHLVQQLLALARADSSQARQMVCRELDPHALLAEGLQQIANAAAQKNIDLALEGADGLRVTGDPGALSILIRNLLDNAVKYTPAGGHILASVERTGEGVRLQVADDGPGIPPADYPAYLLRFKRGGHDVAGSGLGLSIVQRVADLHRARLLLSPGLAGRGLAVSLIFAAD